MKENLKNLIERAEAMLFKQCGNYKPGDLTWKDCIDFALDFHKQELQRIGEVYQKVSVKEYGLPEEKAICFRGDRQLMFQWGDKDCIDLAVTHWLKKLSLLEVKDVTDR